MTDTNPADETLHHLQRLASKPGVQSTLILSRTDGAIVRASGLLVANEFRAPATNGAHNNEDGDGAARAPAAERRARTQVNGDGEGKGQLRNADEVARAVWKFFSAAGGCVEEMVGKGQKEGEDEVRLLRMRLRRSELVVVPDPKFLLVVIHDTPPA